MKKYILSSFLILALALSASAQTDVYLRINHKLGSAGFTGTQVATNNLGNSFTVSRLDYYISEVTLIHDGGQRTPVTDHYIMVRAFDETMDLLGSFNITNLEGVEFGIGVDPGKNHSDITTYPTGHPLSFQLPSMHWGWAAGYRFIAMEGNTGAGMALTWELHALGDGNYGYATVNTTGALNNGNLIIALDADYEQALKDIPVTGSLNYHGESNYAVDIMDNFKTLVFTEGVANIGISELELFEVEMAPNPSSGMVTLRLPENSNGDLVRVTDLTGKVMLEGQIGMDNTMELHIASQGIYMVQIYSGEQLLGSGKLIIQ